MCGIFGYIGSKKDAANLVFEGLKRLEYRGYDSWGVAVVRDDGEEKTIAVKKKTGKIGDESVAELPEGTLSFGHTRWATHGGVSNANAHPHLDCTGVIAVIHNGIFENYSEIKGELRDKGHKFVSETDTEVIAHLIEEYAKRIPFAEAVRQTFRRMSGLNAIIAMNRDERMLIAARNGSPLVIGFGKRENYLSSDPAALLPHTKRVYFLDDGEMAIIREDSVVIHKISSRKIIIPKKQSLTWKISQTEKGKYEYFMLKEIYEQPIMLDQIATATVQYTQKVAKKLQKADQVYLVGSGSSMHECLIGMYLFKIIARLQTNCVVGSEFGYDLDFLTSRSVVLALSQSGETMDLLEPLKKVKAKGVSIVAMTNVLGSSLYRLADEKILIGAGVEKAVATTKAFTGKIAHLILLAYALVGKIEEGREVVRKAAHSIELVLSPRSIGKIKKLAKLLAGKEHLYVIGRGLSYPLSLETALKIKEVSYIHAEGMAAGELKHGTLALIEQGTPCIVYLPDDETYQATLMGAMEMKARGGYLIGVSHKPHVIFDTYIEVHDAGEGSVIPNVVFAQLLAYYLAIKRKLDPDMPRNLAKSVTVK